MTNDTTKAPHCPRCGGEMVRLVSATNFEGSRAGYLVGCHDCGFGGEPPKPVQPMKTAAEMIARSLVRAELARQALEMRAHSAAQTLQFTQNSVYTLDDNMQCVMKDYVWLGTHPLRLPGEEA